MSGRTPFGAQRTSLVDGPDGPLELLTVGHGDPHTLFVHGLAGSIATTRPYGLGVPGSRTFAHLRGHGRSHIPSGAWGYAELAAEVWSLADHVGAGRVLGISMGAGAICRGLCADPDRFERVVLALPAAIDVARGDEAMASLEALATRIEAGDVDALADHLAHDQPAAVRETPEVRAWASEQARALLTPGLAQALHTLPDQVPVTDRELLTRVSAPVLVLAQEGDDTHPVAVAHELVELFPSATMHVADAGGLMWEHRRRTRKLIREFLAG